MEVTITRHDKIDGSHLLKLTCGKHGAQIWVAPWYVQVCSLNASHRAWGGLGKRFDSLQAALASYKSTAMQAMIQVAIVRCN